MIVTAAWLAEHLADSDLRVVDARWRGDSPARALYAAGHIAGAVHIDWHADLAHTVRGVRDRLLGPAAFARVMSAAGIGDDTRVVTYADLDYSGATRLWWALRYYGHDAVAVLDGGLDEWLAQGYPLTTQAPGARPARFTPRPRPALLATAAEIRRALAARAQGAQPGVVLVDTRPLEQYAGQAVWTPPGSRFLDPGATTVDIGARAPIRAGHIPGAVHLLSSDNLDPRTWRYRPPAELRARALAAGVQPEQRVITYCGVGISASLGLFALHLAGYPNVALYDAGWEEWGTDPKLPVEPSEVPVSPSP